MDFDTGECFRNYLNKSKLDSTLGLLDNLKKIDSLYHYTSINALESILNTESLWATRSDFLNDKKELIYTKELIYDVLNAEENILNDTREAVKRFTKLAENSLKEVFVLSFSTNSDSLPLWAYYSRLEGCNFGLNSKAIIGITVKNNVPRVSMHYNTYAGRVQYDIEKQKYEIINSIMFIDKLINEKIDVNEYSMFLLKHFKNYFVFFKSDKFNSEEEFRIAITISEPTSLENIQNTRIVNGLAAKYIVVDLFDNNSNFPINSIRLGPKYSYDIIKQGVNSSVEANGFNIEVNYSELPLRFDS